LHLRCVLDTWNFVYYAVPFLLALVTWEGLARRRPPVLTLLSTVAVWVVWQKLRLTSLTPDEQSLAYLAWAVPAAAGLAVRLYAPGAWSRLASRLQLGSRPSLATDIGPV
jgi:hypothetical protein